ncbi:MAG TPA: VCBS repeat-containing protein [Candidatus Bathyarchaeia archaeon]|nr:VCBS repeat-containing protein [Candidatus Bathyarchaeia archaeon]
MNIKTKVVIVGLLLNLFCSSLCMSIGKCIIISNKEKSTSTGFVGDKVVEEPIILNGTITDYYANGEAVNRGSSTNPFPTETSTNSHPLTKDESLLIKLEEIAALPNNLEQGWVYDDVGTNFSAVNDLFSGHQLYDDNLWGYAINLPGPPGFSLYPNLFGFGGFTSDIATGDVDGDGLDEVIVATDDNYLEIYDDANHNYNKRSFLFENLPEPLSITPFTYIPSDWHIDFLKTIATGDVDGDGIDEIAYVRSFFTGSIEYQYISSWGLWIPTYNDCKITILFWVFDVVEWDFIGECIEVSKSVFSSVSMEPEVAMGDVDGDGLDEIIIGFSFGMDDTEKSDIHIFDDFNHGFTRIWDKNLELDYQPGGYIHDIDIVCGDFDGDKKDEIAIAVCPYNNYVVEGALLIIDDSVMGILGQYGEVAEFRIENPGICWEQRVPVACGDIDGDGRDEIGLVRSFKQGYPSDMFIYEFSQGNYTLRNSFDWDFLDYIFTMGDVDCDGLAELVFSGRYGNYVIDDANTGFTHIMNDTTVNIALLACGDFDGDGMRLKYTGETWTNTAPPGVIIALAAPPVYAGIMQNDDFSWSAFGKATSISTEDTTEIGTTVSSTISFEQTFDFYFFELFSFSWCRTVGREMTLTNTKIKTAVQEISYSSGCWIDSVIYHLTDYQSYKYEITHHPFNTTLIGQFITLDIPFTPTILKTTTNYFDSHYNQTVRLETFNHTIGCPWTYPARNETSSIASECLTSGEPISVGQGTGNNVVTIEIGELSEYGITATTFSDYSIGAAVCGLGFSCSRGTSESKCYEISIGTSCIYEGSVGDILNEARFEELQYSFGIFIYYATHSDGFTYQVINYYVEGAIPYYPAKINLFFVNNWEWLTGVGGGVLGLAIIIPTSVALVKRGKAKPKTMKKPTTKTAK